MQPKCLGFDLGLLRIFAVFLFNSESTPELVSHIVLTISDTLTVYGPREV